MTRTYVPPTEKMTRYLRNLAGERRLETLGRTHVERLATLDAMLDTEELDKWRAMELIDELKAAPLDDAPLVGPGVYRRNDQVFVVKFNRDHTRLYAKRLVESPARVLDHDETIVKADFEYAPGALQTLRPGDQLTLEQGREYLVRYTHCMVCGRELKAAKSVLDSIGPVCRGMFKEEKPAVQLDPGTGDRLAELLAKLGG